MKSGLYAWAGASATASAAACAKRFDEPITNESNVYFGFIPPVSAREGRRGCSIAGTTSPFASATAGAVSSCSDTRSRTSRSAPVTSRTAAPIRPRKWPSIHSRVKSFGTARTNAPSLSSEPPTSPNQVRYVVSLSAPLSRLATSLHRLSAVSSVWCSNAAARSFQQARIGEHKQRALWKQKARICREFRGSTPLSTSVETDRLAPLFRLVCILFLCGEPGG